MPAMWPFNTGRRPSSGAAAIRWEYEHHASSYDQTWSSYLRRSLGLMLAHLPAAPGARILDVGCGTGLLLQQIARRDATATLVGIDLTRGMLARACERVGARSALIHGDGAALPFVDRSFDVVVSSSVLHYADEVVPVLQGWVRVLRPGGTTVITDWCRDFTSMRLLDLVLRVLDPAHGRTVTTAELRAALREAGFVGIQITRHRQGWLWGMLVATAVVPVD